MRLLINVTIWYINTPIQQSSFLNYIKGISIVTSLSLTFTRTNLANTCRLARVKLRCCLSKHSQTPFWISQVIVMMPFTSIPFWPFVLFLIHSRFVSTMYFNTVSYPLNSGLSNIQCSPSSTWSESDRPLHITRRQENPNRNFTPTVKNIISSIK